MWMDIGYARGSTQDQHPALLRILRERMSVRGKADDTPASVSAQVASRVLQAAQAFVRASQEKVR
jgi:hypothetical protein